MADKFRYAECILYPENMIPNWEDYIERLIQCPFCYCIHDKDIESDGSSVKPHVHIILCHNNTVALSWFVKWCNRQLSLEGRKCCSTCEPIINMERAYKYLIHDTDDARKDGKFQYPSNSRKSGNNFDIHHMIQLDENRKLLITQAIDQRIMDFNIMDLTSIRDWVVSQGDEYYTVFVGRSSYFERICSGNWKKWERKRKDDK